jgi:5-methylcytosine-specific restriction endonuclease McrA
MTAMVVRDNKIVLLNADMNELSTITLQKAARLLALDKAVIVEADPVRKLGAWLYPKIIRLKEYVYIAWEKLNGPPKVSKRGVLLRDQHKCAYCGDHATTIDHVYPRSKGGKNTWQNLVAACVKCNHKKGSRTLEEARMTPKWKGYVPTRAQLRS